MELFVDINEMMAVDDIRGENVLFGGTVLVLVIENKAADKRC